MLTQPVIEHFYLGHTSPFQSPNPADSCGTFLRRSSPGEEGVSCRFCCWLGPCSEISHLTVPQFVIYGNLDLRVHSRAR